MVVIKIGRGATQRIIWILALLILAGGLTVAFFHLRDKIFPSTTFELNDELGGNIFPSLILSTATTDTLIVAPTEKGALGNPKSGISIQITSPVKDARLHVEVAETPFFKTFRIGIHPSRGRKGLHGVSRHSLELRRFTQ